MKTRVLIVDDSALVRRMLTEILSSDPSIEVVGTASDPYAARDQIKRLNPDVLTLDVEMPKMDGITFLRNLMRLRPMPVVMISTLTEKGADVTLNALESGAVDFVSKPKVDIAHTMSDYADTIVAKVKVASRARVRGCGQDVKASMTSRPKALPCGAGRPTGHLKTTDRIIAVGASTGGIEAIKDILLQMPADCPGMVVTQHIPESFSASFAKRMDGVCAMTVCEARHGQPIIPGHVYIAPGSQHLLVARDGARYRCELSDGPPVNRHRPAVDTLFRSVTQHVGPNAVGVLLTGMGDDGAEGLKAMRESGAHTIAQDEKTSVVWGMPGEAVKRDAVDSVLPLHRIAEKVLSLV